METKQEITPLFIAKVNDLIKRKVLRNRKEVVDILEWTEPALSNVMGGRRPVPHDKAAKLFKLYGKEKNSLPEKVTGTPIYDINATAGSNENVNQLSEVPAYTVSIPGYEDCNFGMQVYGHSMYPTIESGSLILCKKVNDKQVVMYGEIYLIRTSDYLMTKRLQKAERTSHVLCTSDNFEKRHADFKRFEPFDLERDKIIDLYLVKGIIKKTQT